VAKEKLLAKRFATPKKIEVDSYFEEEMAKYGFDRKQLQRMLVQAKQSSHRSGSFLVTPPAQTAPGSTTRVSNLARCTLKKLFTLRTLASSVKSRCTSAW
jgi:hypothetical protein